MKTFITCVNIARILMNLKLIESNFVEKFEYELEKFWKKSKL